MPVYLLASLPKNLLARHWLLYGYFLSIVLHKSAKVSKRRKAHVLKNGDFTKPLL